MKKLCQGGILCCGAASSLVAGSRSGTAQTEPSGNEPADWIQDLEGRMIKGSETPHWNKNDEALRWIKDLIDNMDAILDEGTSVRLLQACGRSCYINAFGVAGDTKPSSQEAGVFIDNLKKAGYQVTEEGGRAVIVYNWGRDHQNPWGLIMKDGYCLCRVVETGPEGLSPTYCNCSAGYVKEIFERRTGRRVEVKIIDSLKMGGKDCVFRIEIYPA